MEKKYSKTDEGTCSREGRCRPHQEGEVVNNLVGTDFSGEKKKVWQREESWKEDPLGTQKGVFFPSGKFFR